MADDTPETVPETVPAPDAERTSALVDRATRAVTNIHRANPERWSPPPTHEAVDVTDHAEPPKVGEKVG